MEYYHYSILCTGLERGNETQTTGYQILKALTKSQNRPA